MEEPIISEPPNTLIKFCRCCLSRDEMLKTMTSETISFQGIEMKGLTVYDGYLMCSGLTNSYDEFALTKNICVKCVQKLKSAYFFHMLCRKSNDILRENYGILPDNIKKEEYDEFDDDDACIVYDDGPASGDFSQVFVNNFPEIIEKPKPVKKERELLPVIKVDEDLDLANDDSKAETIEDDDDDMDMYNDNDNGNDNDNSDFDDRDFQDDFDDDDFDEEDDEPLNKRRIKVEKTERKKRRDHSDSESSSKKRKKVTKRRREAARLREAMKGELDNPEIENLTAYDVDDFVRTWEKGDYICFFCDEFFPSYIKFREHRNTKHAFNDMGLAKVRRMCNICNQETEGYIKHLTDAHPEYKPNKCHFCLKTFRRQLELRNHLMCHINLEYKCMACNLEMKSQKQLRIHIINTFHSNNYHCPYCALEFKTVQPMVDHAKVLHRKERLWPCHKCKLISLSKGEFESHKCDKVRMNDEEKAELVLNREHKCEQCPTVFNIRDHLNVHTLTVCEKKERYFCEICLKEYQHKRQYTDHMRLHMTRKYQCDQCGVCTASETLLRNHKVMHGDYRPHKCDKCSSSFKRKQELVRHQEVHSELQLECGICGKKFRSQLGIKTHMVYHLPQLKKEPCEICGKKFTPGRYMNLHLKVHAERPFQCSICPADFRNTNQLNVHYKLTHDAESCYECKFCLKQFADSWKLRTHLFVHEEFKKPYECPECGLGITKRDRFKVHLKKSHNMTFDESKHVYKDTEDMAHIIATSLKVNYTNSREPVEPPPPENLSFEQYVNVSNVARPERPDRGHGHAHHSGAGNNVNNSINMNTMHC